jgi:hypothetical protein
MEVSQNSQAVRRPSIPSGYISCLQIMEHLLPGHQHWISSFHGPGTLFRNIKIIKSSTPNQVKLRRLEKTVGSKASGPQLNCLEATGLSCASAHFFHHNPGLIQVQAIRAMSKEGTLIIIHLLLLSCNSCWH